MGTNIRATLLAFSLLLCSNVFATTASETTGSAKVDNPISNSHWSIEGALQAHSVAGPASPWLGLGGSYQIFNAVGFGLRGFLPLSQTVDNATYSVQAYLRVRAVRGVHTDLFFEPEYAENFYNFVPFGSYGLSVGAINHFSPDLNVGIYGGVEVANVVIDSIGLENRSDLIVYPKVAVFTNFTF